MSRLKSFVCCLICFMMLTACADKDAIRIKGNIHGITQADFLIYSPDGGINKLDTIHVIDGKFDWQIPLKEEATFVIIYPNFSEQVVFAQPGDVITMKGDAGQLRQITVTGSADNEAMTQFRLQHLNDKEADRKAAMQTYVNENPDSRISIYLQRQLTLESATFSRLRKGERLPTIMLPPDRISDDEDTIYIQHTKKKEPESMQGRPLLILFWATWNGPSHTLNERARQLINKTKKNPTDKRIQALSISLDVDLRSYNIFLNRDTVDWPHRCYRRSWNTPVVTQCAVTNIPFAILTDADRRIIAIGANWERDIKEEAEKYIVDK